jgi:hypothetical protein
MQFAISYFERLRFPRIAKKCRSCAKHRVPRDTTQGRYGKQLPKQASSFPFNRLRKDHCSDLGRYAVELSRRYVVFISKGVGEFAADIGILDTRVYQWAFVKLAFKDHAVI